MRTCLTMTPLQPRASPPWRLGSCWSSVTEVPSWWVPLACLQAMYVSNGLTYSRVLWQRSFLHLRMLIVPQCCTLNMGAQQASSNACKMFATKPSRLMRHLNMQLHSPGGKEELLCAIQSLTVVLTSCMSICWCVNPDFDAAVCRSNLFPAQCEVSIQHYSSGCQMPVLR